MKDLTCQDVKRVALHDGSQFEMNLSISDDIYSSFRYIIHLELQFDLTIRPYCPLGTPLEMIY